MKTLDVVLGLIQQGDKYHLQLRNHKDSTGGTNLIGCFGGRIEKGETPLQAVCRELAEETFLEPTESELIFIGKIDVVSDFNSKPTKINGHAFRINIEEQFKLNAKEGELLSLSMKDLKAHLPKMTPGTLALFKNYIL